MRRRIGFVLAAALCFCMGASTVQAQINPNGWINSDGWAYLFPLGNDFGAGPPPAVMKENWVPPHVIGDESPAAGDNWGDIDFAASPSSGYFFGNLAPAPIWYTLDFLVGAFPALADGAAPADIERAQDLVNYQDHFVNRLNQHVTDGVPLVPDQTNLPGDNVLAIAVTYIDNISGAPIAADICTASDDSIQVWVNNKCILNKSIPRGSAADCQERSPAFIPTGVSKITSLIWEGGGGHNFRLAVEVGGAKLADGNDMIDFLGAAGEGQIQYCVDRDVAIDTDEQNCPNPDAAPPKVTITGAGPGDEADAITVVECILAPLAGALTISDVTGGGVVEDKLPDAAPFTYSQDFDAFADGDTDLGDGSAISGPVAQVLGGGLRLTDAETTSTSASFRIPAIGDSKSGWTANFDVFLEDIAGGNPPADGFSFNYGAIPATGDGAAEEGFGGGSPILSVEFDTWMIGDTEHGFNVAIDQTDVPGGFVAADILTDGATVNAAVSISWTPADGVTLVFDGNPIFTNLATPGFLGSDAYSFAFSARTGGATETLIIDNLVVDSIVKGPPTAIGKTITWETTRGELSGGLCYSIDSSEDQTANLSGTAIGEAVVGGPSSIAFAPSVAAAATGAIGAFINSHPVGGGNAGGSLSYNAIDDSYTMEGSGDDVWNGGDQMYFAYKKLSGDFRATVRITERNPPVGGRWGKHGLMARWTCDGNSKHSSMETQLATNPAETDTPRHHHRNNHLDNGSNEERFILDDGTLPGFPGVGLPDDRWPEWLRIERHGNTLFTFAAFADEEGNPIEWCTVGSDHWAGATPDTVLVGVYLTSHAGANLAEISFDNFSCESLTPSDNAVLVLDELANVGFDDPAQLGIVVDNDVGNFSPAIVDGRLRVTEDGVGGQAHAVWYGVVADENAGGSPIADTGFVVEFDAYMSKGEGGCDPEGDPNPADGFAFAAVATGQNDGLVSAVAPWPPGLDVQSLRGDGGGSMAYNGNTMRQRTECHPSFAVEMDNWSGGGNNEGIGSPGNDCQWHMGLDFNSNVDSEQIAEGLPDIFAPEGVHITVRYDPSGRVTAWANDTQVLDGHFPPLPSGDLVLGFVGGTGGATARQEVDNFVVRSTLAAPSILLAADCNEDGAIDISDVLCDIKVLFGGFLLLNRTPQEPPCGGDEVLNINGDGSFDVSDIAYLVNWLFRAGPAPVQGGCFGSDADCDANPSCQ